MENRLDLWGQTGLNPKCELWCLPTTIDEFMARHKPTDNTYPTLHTLQQYPTIINNPDDSHDIILCLGKQQSSDMNNLPDSRKSMDMFRDACGQHGHPWKCCDYLAKLIKALDFASKLDKPKQLEILAAFHKEQQNQSNVTTKSNAT